jgi:hypothetical protein
VRAEVEARMKAQKLTTAELARRAKMAQGTVRTFRQVLPVLSGSLGCGVTLRKCDT